MRNYGIVICIRSFDYFTIGNQYLLYEGVFGYYVDDDRGITCSDFTIDGYFIPIEEWREIKLGELGI